MEKWGIRIFKEGINSMLHERTAISKKPEETVKHDLAQQVSQQVRQWQKHD